MDGSVGMGIGIGGGFRAGAGQRRRGIGGLLFPEATPELMVLCAQNREGMGVMREEDAEEENGQRDGNDFFGCEGEPEESEPGSACDLHPRNGEEGAEENEKIAPTVGDHPPETEAEQKARVEEEEEEIFEEGAEFVFHGESFLRQPCTRPASSMVLRMRLRMVILLRTKSGARREWCGGSPVRRWMTRSGRAWQSRSTAAST